MTSPARSNQALSRLRNSFAQSANGASSVAKLTSLMTNSAAAAPTATPSPVTSVGSTLSSPGTGASPQLQPSPALTATSQTVPISKSSLALPDLTQPSTDPTFNFNLAPSAGQATNNGVTSDWPTSFNLTNPTVAPTDQVLPSLAAQPSPVLSTPSPSAPIVSSQASQLPVNDELDKLALFEQILSELPTQSSPVAAQTQPSEVTLAAPVNQVRLATVPTPPMAPVLDSPPAAPVTPVVMPASVGSAAVVGMAPPTTTVTQLPEPSPALDQIAALAPDPAAVVPSPTELSPNANLGVPVEPTLAMPTSPITPPDSYADPVPTDDLGPMAAALPTAVAAQAQAQLNPVTTGASAAKERLQVAGAVAEQPDLGGGVTTIEQELTPEISPEVSAYLQKVENHVELQPQEVVIANQVPQVLPAKPLPKPVIVLPITPEEEAEARGKNTAWSVSWLVEWSHKIIKMFAGKVVYRQEPAQK